MLLRVMVAGFDKNLFEQSQEGKMYPGLFQDF